MILQDDLKADHYYIGEGRFMGEPQVALWDGKNFLGMGTDCGFKVVNYADYGNTGFTPLREVI